MKKLEGLRVLVAEDDILIAMHCESLLEDAGAVTRLVTNCEELSGIPPQDFDVALLDKTLTDGETTSLAASFIEGGCAVLFYSGGDGGALRAKVPRATILEKPASDDTIILAVARAKAG
jgi:DNA-binding NtrC family response regulator